MKNVQSENSSGKKGLSLPARIVLRLVTLVVAAALIFLGARFALREMTRVRVEKRHAMVERTLSECAELVVYKMRYSDIVTIRKKGALSKAFSIVRFSGVLRTGIENIKESVVELSDDGRRVRVRIPPTVLLGNEISSEEVFDEQQRLFNRITTQEVFDEIARAKDEAAEDILADGLLDESDERAIGLIKQLLLGLGFESVAVELK